VHTLFEVGVSNAVVVAVLAVAVAGIARVWRRPTVVYCLWVLVLLKLVTPPVWRIPVEVPTTTKPTERSVAAAAEPVGTLGLEIGPDSELSGEGTGDESRNPLVPPGLSHSNAQPTESVAAIRPPLWPGWSLASWGTVLASVWLTGSGLWFLLAGFRTWRFRRLLRQALPAPQPLQVQGAKLAEKLGLRRRFDIRVVYSRVPPLLWALGRRPTVLFPHELLNRLDAQQQETLLTHELAHLRRGDHRVRWLELITLGLYWWHPVTWWARRQLQQAEEECCDAWVVWALPAQARAYANALLKTLDFLSEAQPAVPPVASGFARVHSFQRRFTMILHHSLSRRLSWPSRGTLLLVGTLALSLSPHAVSGTAPEEKTAPAAAAGTTDSFETTVGSERIGASVLTRTADVKYRVPKQNLEIPDDLKGCAEKLRMVYQALVKYEKDKAAVPDWLTDLVPDYLSAETLFCPADPRHHSSYWADPKGPCSYCWELSPSELRSRPPLDKTMRDYKVLQRRMLGDVVPIVRCFHHGRVLNLAWDGQIYTSAEWFENLFVPRYRHSMLLVEGKPEAATIIQAQATPEAAAEKAKVLALDDFDGKLHLDWMIFHADPSHYSLEKNLGALTITTQAGSFSKSHQADYKNLFLIDCPKADGEDLRLTTCICSFTPQVHWNQAGLIFWKDEDNYVKCCYQTWYGRRVIAVVTETDGSMENALHHLVDGQPGKIWLRFTKRGNVYQLATSLDGKSFESHGATRWGDGSIEKVGILALNGSHHTRPELDAAFEVFEAAAVSATPPENIPSESGAFPHRPARVP